MRADNGSCVGQSSGEGLLRHPHARHGTALAPRSSGILPGTLTTGQGTCPQSPCRTTRCSVGHLWGIPPALCWDRRHPVGPSPPHRGQAGACPGKRWWRGEGARLEAAHDQPSLSRCSSSCPQLAAPLGMCRHQAQLWSLRGAFVQGTAPHIYVQALGSSWRDRDPFPAPPLAGTIPSPRARGSPRLCQATSAC